MPPPMLQAEARQKLSSALKLVNSVLVSPKEGLIDSRTDITYICGRCGKEHTKNFNNLTNGQGGALCSLCAQARGNERRIASLNAGPKWTINNGETDFNRTLASETASKDGSTLLGIYRKESHDSYTIIEHDSRITRESYLHIMCQCGEEDYINFRNAYGSGATEPGKGLCLCRGCRKGHKSASLRKIKGSDESTTDALIESLSKRAARIERDGQVCNECKKHQPVSEFFGLLNDIEKCKVYKSRCYSCSRKLRTSNREDALRNGTIEMFMKGELDIAKDRNKKHNKKNPDDMRDFNITVRFLMELFERQDGKCALSGMPMLTTTHRDECPEDERCNPSKLSIDRIDSLRGYMQDNVQLVRWRANSMKLDMTIDEYYEEIRLSYEKRFGKNA